MPESADGGPIRGFGNNGRVQTAFPVKAYTRPGAPRGAVAEGIARYGKHRLILAGFASNGENNDIAVVRYLANGKLDPSFGLNGKLVTDLGDNEEGIDVAVDRQGRIVVVGFANSYALNLGDVLVARYLADGTPDDSFGMNGIASPGRGGALAVAIDSHDRVLISGGGKNDHGSYGWFVERLTPAGDPDPDFGTDGRVEGFVAESSHAVDVAIDSQDRVAFAVCGDNEKDPRTSLRRCGCWRTARPTRRSATAARPSSVSAVTLVSTGSRWTTVGGSCWAGPVGGSWEAASPERFWSPA